MLLKLKSSTLGLVGFAIFFSQAEKVRPDPGLTLPFLAVIIFSIENKVRPSKARSWPYFFGNFFFEGLKKFLRARAGLTFSDFFFGRPEEASKNRSCVYSSSQDFTKHSASVSKTKITADAV